jgi:hypothetical protein
VAHLSTDDAVGALARGDGSGAQSQLQFQSNDHAPPATEDDGLVDGALVAPQPEPQDQFQFHVHEVGPPPPSSTGPARAAPPSAGAARGVAAGLVDVWTTGPRSPGLKMLIATLMFVGATCGPAAVELAAAAVAAAWIAAAVRVAGAAGAGVGSRTAAAAGPGSLALSVGDSGAAAAAGACGFCASGCDGTGTGGASLSAFS